MLRQKVPPPSPLMLRAWTSFIEQWIVIKHLYYTCTCRSYESVLDPSQSVFKDGKYILSWSWLSVRKDPEQNGNLWISVLDELYFSTYWCALENWQKKSEVKIWKRNKNKLLKNCQETKTGEWARVLIHLDSMRFLIQY